MSKLKHNKKYFEKYASDLKPYFTKQNIIPYYGERGLVARRCIAQYHWRGVVIGKTCMKRYGWKKSLVVFLHELGHIIAHDMEMTYIQTNIKTVESVAWLVAKAMFDELDWPITDKYFDKIMKSCLKAYGVSKI